MACWNLACPAGVRMVQSMMDASEHIGRWREAGLLDAATAERLLAFERERARGGGSEPGLERPGVLEAIVYLGILVAGVGVFTLAASNWDTLESWARVAVVAVPLVLAFVAGLGLLQAEDPGVRRGGQFAWLAVVALTAGTIAIVAEEYGGDRGAGDRGILLLDGLVTAGVALGLWVASPRLLQVLALGGALVFLGMTIAAWPDEFDARLGGMAMLAFGVAGLFLAERKLLTPVPAARLVFAALTAWGPFFAGIDGSQLWAELLGFAVAAAIGVLGIWRASFVYIAVAVVAGFVMLVQFMFEHFAKDLGAPLALIISGGLLIGGVLVLTRVRGSLRHRKAQ